MMRVLKIARIVELSNCFNHVYLLRLLKRGRFQNLWSYKVLRLKRRYIILRCNHTMQYTHSRTHRIRHTHMHTACAGYKMLHDHFRRHQQQSLYRIDGSDPGGCRDWRLPLFCTNGYLLQVQ